MGYEKEANVSVLISEEEVNARIAEMGAQITERFKGESVYLICILRGSIFFTTELAKRIDLPMEIDFMTVSSYGAETVSSGVINIKQDLAGTIEGKNVIVVEDIIDSGRTLSYLIEILKQRKPNSLRLCTLLDKKERRVVDVDVDYCCFDIPDEFVVGFGLDYAQKYRNLPYIGVVEFEEE